MTQLSEAEGRAGCDNGRPASAPIKRESRLMSGIYRDIGLAAVAIGLEVTIDDLDSEVGEAVMRGTRYIRLMPRMDARAP